MVFYQNKSKTSRQKVVNFLIEKAEVVDFQRLPLEKCVQDKNH